MIINPYSPVGKALENLRLMGFVGRKVGDHDSDPDAIFYFRDVAVDIQDIVTMKSEHEVEAVRLVSRKLVLQTYGTLPEVVSHMLFRWPDMPAANGKDRA